MKYPFFESIWQHGGEIYAVGGAVRDSLISQSAKDDDYLVTGLSFTQLKEILSKTGKVALVGKSFGVLKWTSFDNSNLVIDLALPRKEKSTGIGHQDFTVTFDPHLPVEEDLKRRDFTINAIACNVRTKEYIDPFNGRQDLRHKKLRQVFPQAFEEDPLRLIRAVQFAARFELQIEELTWTAMQKHAALIKTVSPERIIEELRKLFLATKPSLGFDLMLASGLMHYVLPEIEALVGVQQDKMPGDDVYRHTMRVVDAAANDSLLDHPGDLEVMLAALFHDCGKPATRRYDKAKDRIVFYSHQVVSARLARQWMRKMRVTTIGVNPQHVNALIFNHMFETKSYFTDRAIRRFVNKVGQDLIYKLLDLRLADNRGGKHPNSVKGVEKMRRRVREELEKKPPFGTQDLAITGHDLMEMGFEEGPGIGKVLKELVEIVLDEPEKNHREALSKIVEEMIEEDPALLRRKTFFAKEESA